MSFFPGSNIPLLGRETGSEVGECGEGDSRARSPAGSRACDRGEGKGVGRGGGWGILVFRGIFRNDSSIACRLVAFVSRSDNPRRRYRVPRVWVRERPRDRLAVTMGRADFPVSPGIKWGCITSDSMESCGLFAGMRGDFSVHRHFALVRPNGDRGDSMTGTGTTRWSRSEPIFPPKQCVLHF